MSKLYPILLVLIKRFMSRFAEPLPVGMTQYERWEADIFDLAGRFADETSMRFAVASILIHAPSDKGALPKKYFVDRLRKSAANQIASQVFQDVKLAQEARTKAAEVTTATNNINETL